MMPATISPLGEAVLLSRRPEEIEATGTYDVAGVLSFGRGVFRREPISGDQTKYKVLFRLKAGQLVVSRLKAFEGAIAVVPDELDGSYVSQEFPTFDLDPSKIDAGYLRRLCQWPALWEQLRRQSRGVGARRERVHEEDILKLMVPLPPIDEQHRIASYLDESLDTLEVVAESVRAVETASILAVFPTLVDRTFTRRRAKPVKLGELVEVVTDSVKPGADSSPAEAFIGLQHVEMHTGRLLGFEDLGMEKAEKRCFSRGDIVYGTLRPNLNKVWVADRPGLCSVDQRVLRARQGFDPELVAHGMRSAPFLSQVMALVPGLQLPRIRLTKLLELKIQWVDVAQASGTSDDIRASLAQVTALVDLRRRRERLLAALTPSLLSATFVGWH